jgi:hypothetical protein
VHFEADGQQKRCVQRWRWQRESLTVTLVNAPVSGGRDPFEWLPDELVVMIIEKMPFESVWRGGACERVLAVGAADEERAN